MTKVLVFGPNLTDQSKGQFHVHADGCGDVKHYGGRETKFGGGDGWELDVAERRTVAMDVYPPGEFDYEESDFETSAYWDDEIWFAPCLKDLPWKGAA